MRNKIFGKGLVLAIVVLFLGMTFVSSAGSLSIDRASTNIQICKSNSRDDNDTTPPVTTISFDPSEPNGENGWYVTNITVILNATDDMSGVKEIIYIYHGYHVIPGDNGTFIIEEGDDLVEYWAVDNAGNEEIPHHTFIVPFIIDKTCPDEEVTWEAYKIISKWYVDFICNAADAVSGMARVEMYINNLIYQTIEGSGPVYTFTIEWTQQMKSSTFKFVAYDMAGNSAFVIIDGMDIKSHSSSQQPLRSLISQQINQLLQNLILCNQMTNR